MALLLPHSREPQPTHPSLPPSLPPTRLLIPPLPSFPINSLRSLLSPLCYTFNTPPPFLFFPLSIWSCPTPTHSSLRIILNMPSPTNLRDPLSALHPVLIPLGFIFWLYYTNTREAAKQFFLRRKYDIWPDQKHKLYRPRNTSGSKSHLIQAENLIRVTKIIINILFFWNPHQVK